MELSDDQYKELEQFAPLSYKPEKLAEIIGADVDLFLKDYNDPKSKIAKIVNVAILKAEGEIELNFLTSAKNSITAAQEWNKRIKAKEIEAYKDELDGSTEEPENKFAIQKEFNDSLDHYYALQDFISKNSANNPLPAELKEYWRRLDIAHDLFNNFGNRGKGYKYIVNLLRRKFPKISESTAYRYISESINFFGVNLSKDQWRIVQFEKLDKLISLALKMNKLEVIEKFIKEQNDILMLKQLDPPQIPPEALAQKTYILVTNIEEVGGEKVSRKEIKKWIDGWSKNLTDFEKQRLYDDAKITDVEELKDE